MMKELKNGQGTTDSRAIIIIIIMIMKMNLSSRNDECLECQSSPVE
jgi:hypothetical protein